MAEALAELVEALGAVASDAVSEVTLGESFDRALEFHATVMEVEMAHNLHRDYEKGAAQMSGQLRAIIERGRTRLAIDYTRATAAIAPLNAALETVLDEYDAILTAPQAGPAPLGLGATGNPVFCTIWTYLGTPAITLPLMQSTAGLPLGVQLVGRRGADARLLRTARWLAATLAARRPRKREVPARPQAPAVPKRRAR
jgi:Asp-tRNA(Asn)/Glu-tRNA(Gln) amidotransferase A subunit family amidase